MVHSVTRIGRREFIASAAGVLGVLTTGARRSFAKAPALRISLPSAGSAGSIWRPVMNRLGLLADLDADLQWIGGDPGQTEVQLLSGALDVSVFGAVGLSRVVEKGSDITLFGPALNNHGRWIVHANSLYKHPADLVGKRIATQPKTTETYQQARIAAQLIGLDLERDYQLIFGPPTANLALFGRGDVEAVILIEPTATRLVGSGAREIARVGDMWREGSGSQEEPFLVGLAARRSWLDANRQLATQIANVFAQTNAAIHAKPDLLTEFHNEMGLKDGERAAIALLPDRLKDVYPVTWNKAVWQTIDKQVALAIKFGMLKGKPIRALYDGRALA